MKHLATEIAIVGAGPAGMMLAIELGCRDIPCILIEEDLAPPKVPKANATSSRTMEHYRRRGFADLIRNSALPGDYPHDVAYCTRLLGRELARLQLPCGNDIQSGVHGDYGDENWPTPELPHRGQQMFIEPILLDQARRHPSVQVIEGVRATQVRDLETQVELDAQEIASGQEYRVRAKYVVGCDAARSIVRKAMNVEYQGRGHEDRNFFGGQMMTIYFRADALYALMGRHGMPKAWQWWICNPERRGAFAAINGVDTFACAIQLGNGQNINDLDIASTLATLAGEAFGFELLAKAQWTAGYTLVADRFKVGRLLLAGDAAHLFTPAAGMGYNTSIDDVVNLGWKLAAVTQGWAPPTLLDTYEIERRPIAIRNTSFARAMADSMGKLVPPADIESSTSSGEEARDMFGARCLEHIRKEFNIPGLQLGVRYVSDVVAKPVEAAPPDEPNHYVATAYPGSRAPHVSDGNGGSIFDHFGRDFTLLCFDMADRADGTALGSAIGMPVTVLPWSDPVAREIYGADRVLVRPDHHIAWRGSSQANIQEILSMAVAGTLDPIDAMEQGTV